MSYCVNCGVELAPSEKQCPLCDTLVINPNSPWKETVQRPYSQHIERLMSQVNRRYGATLATLLLLIPIVLSVISNILFDRMISWSGYVVGACICLFVWVLVPLLNKKKRPYFFLFLDFLATLLYLGLIADITGHYEWYFPVAAPLTFDVYILAFVIVLVHRSKKIFGLYKGAVVISTMGIVTVIIETIIFLGTNGQFYNWSIFVLIPCLMIAMIFIYIERHKKLKDEIRRRLFI
ncbi:MAG: DUF6320 domain-containing protein [Christensenellales bacterium]